MWSYVSRFERFWALMKWPAGRQCCKILKLYPEVDIYFGAQIILLTMMLSITIIHTYHLFPHLLTWSPTPSPTIFVLPCDSVGVTWCAQMGQREQKIAIEYPLPLRLRPGFQSYDCFWWILSCTASNECRKTLPESRKWCKTNDVKP